MTKPVRLQLSRKRGFNLQELSRATNGLPAVNVARPGKHGNPFTISFCQSWFGISEKAARIQAVELHKQWIDGTLEPGWTDKVPPTEDEIRAEIRGKNVACFCGAGEPCHGDNLLEVANQ